MSTGESTNLDSGTFSDDFHVFSLEWDSSAMKFALDGNVYMTRTKPLPNGATWPFDQPFYFILNLAVGGIWPGPPTSATKFPQEMNVSWVRVSQKLEDIPLSGKDLVAPGAQHKRYEVPQMAGVTYRWTVPDGATIVSGNGTNTIHVDWGDESSSGAVSVQMTADCGTSVASMPVTVTSNLWGNPSFVDGFAGWEQIGNGKFEIFEDSADGDAHAARVTVSQIGQYPWSVQLVRQGIKLKQNVRYSVSFWARSDQPRTIPFSFIDGTTYATYATKRINVTTDWNEFTLTFRQPADATALFTTDLAAAIGVYDFDGFLFSRSQQ